MTEEIFKQDPYRAEAEACYVCGDARGIRLDRTIFYPRGGGQAGDAGVLVRGDASSIAISDTVKGEAPGEILHVPAPGQEAILASLAAGEKVTLHLDWARRHRHMRFHTATHLLCAIIPHQTNGCSITAQYARLDPHATSIVYQAPVPEHVSIGLDVTMRCLYPCAESIAAFNAAGGPLEVVSAATEVWAKHSHRIVFHDPRQLSPRDNAFIVSVQAVCSLLSVLV